VDGGASELDEVAVAQRERRCERRHSGVPAPNGVYLRGNVVFRRGTLAVSNPRQASGRDRPSSARANAEADTDRAGRRPRHAAGARRGAPAGRREAEARAVTLFRELLLRLGNAGVEFVVVGGLAVISHGHVRATVDLDVCYARTPENIR